MRGGAQRPHARRTLCTLSVRLRAPTKQMGLFQRPARGELPMASAVTQKILHVDLTTRQTRVEEIPETILRTYMGGGALACHLLLRELPPGVDPLGPDNVLVFTTSIINGMSLSGTNRYTAAAKSPLTGGYGESEAGGWGGPALRAAGWDGVTVRGRAAAPRP